MTAEKAQIRAAAVHELGVRLDDGLEAAERQVHGLQGAAQGLAKGRAAVLALHAEVDRASEAGDLELPQAQVAKDWITRAALALERSALEAERHALVAQGRAEGLRAAVAIAKRSHEESAAEGRRQAEGGPASRVPIKRRRARAAAPNGA